MGLLKALLDRKILTMKTSKPVPRLKTKSIGDEVELFGDWTNRKFTVANIRDDGYYELSHNGKIVVTASECHEIRQTR